MLTQELQTFYHHRDGSYYITPVNVPTDNPYHAVLAGGRHNTRAPAVVTDATEIVVYQKAYYQEEKCNRVLVFLRLQFQKF